MTAHLPPSLLALFAPRPPIPFIPPPEKINYPDLTGISSFVQYFENPVEPEKLAPGASDGGRDPFETKKMRKKRKIREKIKAHQQQNEENAKKWDPTKDPKSTGDPYRTLFITKMNYNTTEHKLKREFEIYGPIKKVRIVTDQNGKPRGYAFIEFEKERDMRAACKEGDGKKIDGRRVLVDVERGRTMRGWRPRKLGGGLGYSRATSEEREIMREKEREKERERERERERARESDSRGGDRKRERESERDRERDKERDRHRDGHRDRSDRERDRGRDRGRDGEGDRKRPRSREREGGSSRPEGQPQPPPLPQQPMDMS